MEYISVKWKHHFVDEPVEIYSEVDGKRNETRKIEIFSDGSFDFASLEIPQNIRTKLSTVPLPTIDEIRKDKQFFLLILTQEDFEKKWEELVLGN